MAEKNKVEFGLENVHYAAVTYDELTGKATYGEVKKWPGAVELSLEPAGDVLKFKADNIDYWTNQNNQGYEGTFTSALVPDEFATNHLGETLNKDGTVSEYATAQSTPFALMYQFEGDKNATRYVLYHCVANRAPLGSTTKDNGEPNTRAMNFTASPRPDDKLVKHKAYKDQVVYNTWFDAVVEPTPPTEQPAG